MGILRQKWSVQIGGDHIFIYDALIPGFPGISKTIGHFPERSVIPDLRASPVIFKSHYRAVKQQTVQHDITDETLRFPVRCDIQYPQPLYRLLICFIVLSKELVSAAHCQHDAAVLYIFSEIVFDILQETADQFLLSVRAAPEQNDIKLRKINRISRQERDHFCFDPAPFKPFAEALDISSVSVQVQKIRV